MGNRTYERFTKASTHSKDYTYYQNSNRLLSDGKYAFVYDDDGNLIRKGNKFTLSGETVSFTTDGKGVEYWEYSYNLRNQLSQVQRNGQLVATYAYDGLGLRVSALTTITSKTTGQSKTTTRDYLFDLADRVIYDKVISTAGSLPAAEDPETSTENSYVFAGGTHFAKVEGAIGATAEVYYYHNDHLGSPMAITDSQGNVAWSQDYLPYGEALNENATETKTRFTFTGKELDPATGLMYYNARWYDPDLGRFMTEDTYAGDPNDPRSLNFYMYVGGNPLRYTDPTGHKWDVGSDGRYTADANDLTDIDDSGVGQVDGPIELQDDDGRSTKDDLRVLFGDDSAVSLPTKGLSPATLLPDPANPSPAAAPSGPGTPTPSVSAPPSDTEMLWPTDPNAPITSGYGKRTLNGITGFHKGIDIGVPVGEPVYAATEGEVVISDTIAGYGKTVVVKNEDTYSLYGHLSKTEVKVGDQVTQGQVIAESGNTGKSTGPHLHFEVREGKGDFWSAEPVDPMQYL